MGAKKVNAKKEAFSNDKKGSRIDRKIDAMLCNLTDYQFSILRLDLLDYFDKENGGHKYPP